MKQELSKNTATDKERDAYRQEDKHINKKKKNILHKKLASVFCKI